MLHPDDTFEFYLDDRGPESERPTLIYRYKSAREWMEYSRKRKAAADAKTDEDYMNALMLLACDGLVGWRNIKTLAGRPVEEVPAHLDEVLTLAGLQDLTNTITIRAGICERDLKKSVSPSPSNTGAYAGAAAGASA